MGSTKHALMSKKKAIVMARSRLIDRGFDLYHKHEQNARWT